MNEILFEVPAALQHHFIIPDSSAFGKLVSGMEVSAEIYITTAYCHNFAQLIQPRRIRANADNPTLMRLMACFFHVNTFIIHPGSPQIMDHISAMPHIVHMPHVWHLHIGNDVFTREQARDFFQGLATCSTTSPHRQVIISKRRITKIAKGEGRMGTDPANKGLFFFHPHVVSRDHPRRSEVDPNWELAEHMHPVG
jgi:hypothetical protein